MYAVENASLVGEVGEMMRAFGSGVGSQDIPETER